jgi:hypothetical protein
MTTPYKFGYLDSVKNDIPSEYSDTWAIEKTTGPERLVIAPRKRHMKVLWALIEKMPEPFDVLYVFLVPRTDRPAGRYQSPYSISRDRLAAFLNRFEQYFEGDGRHDIWVYSATDSSLLVYDQHNINYAYSPLDAFKEILTLYGLQPVTRIDFPAPYTHHYNKEFDADQDALLNYWSWRISPLREQD